MRVRLGRDGIPMTIDCIVITCDNNNDYYMSLFTGDDVPGRLKKKTEEFRVE